MTSSLFNNRPGRLPDFLQILKADDEALLLMPRERSPTEYRRRYTFKCVFEKYHLFLEKVAYVSRNLVELSIQHSNVYNLTRPSSRYLPSSSRQSTEEMGKFISVKFPSLGPGKLDLVCTRRPCRKSRGNLVTSRSSEPAHPTAATDRKYTCRSDIGSTDTGSEL